MNSILDIYNKTVYVKNEFWFQRFMKWMNAIGLVQS